MSRESIARRYAKAIFELGNETNSLDKLTEEFKSVGDLVASNRELEAVLSNPTVTPAARKAIMADIAQKLGVSPMAKNALLLIADHGRASLFPRIALTLSELADAKAGKVRAEVVSATALTDAQASKLAAALEKLSGRKISLVRKVDPTLIGGVVARVGDTVYDGSVRSRLTGLRQTLLPN